MEFFVRPNFSYELSHLRNRVPFDNLHDNLNIWFSEKNYGQKITEIYAQVICVSTGFEKVLVPRPPKIYRKSPSLEVEYSLEFDRYVLMGNNERYKYIWVGLFNTLTTFFETKKVKDFDQESFLKDLKIFWAEKADDFQEK